jgi:RecB family endonuclease NucS
LDKAGNEVALELKNLHGGKSAVEQVLRYLGMLKQQFKGKKVRGILVTGILGVDTAKALHGMTEEQKNVIDWYLYNYNKNTQHLIFEKVNYKFIAEHLDNG